MNSRNDEHLNSPGFLRILTKFQYFTKTAFQSCCISLVRHFQICFPTHQKHLFMTRLMKLIPPSNSELEDSKRVSFLKLFDRTSDSRHIAGPCPGSVLMHGRLYGTKALLHRGGPCSKGTSSNIGWVRNIRRPVSVSMVTFCWDQHPSTSRDAHNSPQ